MKLQTRFTTVLAFSAMALASAGIAQADGASTTGASTTVAAVSSITTDQHAAAREVYEGVDTAGRRIRLTISDGGPQVLIQVDRQPALPAAHWTSLIGTGAAASAER